MRANPPGDLVLAAYSTSRTDSIPPLTGLAFQVRMTYVALPTSTAASTLSSQLKRDADGFFAKPFS